MQKETLKKLHSNSKKRQIRSNLSNRRSFNANLTRQTIVATLYKSNKMSKSKQAAQKQPQTSGPSLDDYTKIEKIGEGWRRSRRFGVRTIMGVCRNLRGSLQRPRQAHQSARRHEEDPPRERRRGCAVDGRQRDLAAQRARAPQYCSVSRLFILQY